MLNIQSDQSGSIFWAVAFIVVIAVWGLYTLSQRANSPATVDGSNVNEVATTAIETVDVQNENTTTKSFTTVNGYDTSRGKAIITEDKFGYFNASVAAVMPSEFPGTYYQAKLTGSGTTPSVSLGRMDKTGGSYTVQHVSSRPISDYFQIVISVDGDAATVEGKALPHNVMVLDL